MLYSNCKARFCHKSRFHSNRWQPCRQRIQKIKTIGNGGLLCFLRVVCQENRHLDTVCHTSTSDFQGIDPKRRDKLLRKLKDRGLSIRQISRLTGISKGIVERTQNRPLSQSYLRQKIGQDPHQIKKDYLGQKADISKYDLYQNKDTGQIFIVEQSTRKIVTDTCYFLKQGENNVDELCLFCN